MAWFRFGYHAIQLFLIWKSNRFLMFHLAWYNAIISCIIMHNTCTGYACAYFRGNLLLLIIELQSPSCYISIKLRDKWGRSRFKRKHSTSINEKMSRTYMKDIYFCVCEAGIFFHRKTQLVYKRSLETLLITSVVSRFQLR